MESTCPQCQLDFERNPGAFIGGVGLNTTVTFASVAVAIGFAFAFTDSDRTIGSVLFWPLLLAAVIPIVFFPYSKTLWLAVEFITTPPDTSSSDTARSAGGPPAPASSHESPEADPVQR